MTEAVDPKGRVLIIAGSDSGGGAGIQADIKTVTMLGGYAMTAVTAITVQDTKGVHGVWPVPIDAVIGQMRVTLADIGADVIKTGMLGSAALVEAIAECLDEHALMIPRVIDPVMVATSGDRLVDAKAVEAIRSELVPRARLVTPNAPEAEVLTGKAVESLDGQRRAADRLLELGAHGALVKGGHIGGSVITDVLQTTTGEWLFESPRINTRSTHGTGCTLASAIATYLGLGVSVPDSVEQGRDYLMGALRTAKGLGTGHGPVNHGWLLDRD
ncbi:MAG: bifunctional hydroxymethylpyrimidine kinase/phosphomethylpyrimidine kinase [Alphaproteobacteria bacterium]|nr:bifunctional hydroxymethylpyrimidine kinase/phosphomethylpyrimidine kinase [Alphaproteobacteria bacterium]MBU2084726.1 bifunctional hydroxymethylpyrimidine kinase/phosphomethylpyrimidine kinase [Alphaproteobacteria bacterium]MBU2144202.1 bifunctional hydroxymethylpyrimidine kinase/phosphomethylpyrimidine kinase [Alphaproteobacteria bacterium]MBU2198311.1 bifunctional hydroxymethylpyrimidine kinase/phosphomethylpyrimidine kinase [Alphaproteobacteria bacterium]